MGRPDIKNHHLRKLSCPQICAFQPVVNALHLEQGAQRILFSQGIHNSFRVDYRLDIMQWLISSLIWKWNCIRGYLDRYAHK